MVVNVNEAGQNYAMYVMAPGISGRSSETEVNPAIYKGDIALFDDSFGNMIVPQHDRILALAEPQ